MAEVDAVEHADGEVQGTRRPAGEVVKDYSALRASAESGAVPATVTRLSGGFCAVRRRPMLSIRNSISGSIGRSPPMPSER